MNIEDRFLPVCWNCGPNADRMANATLCDNCREKMKKNICWFMGYSSLNPTQEDFDAFIAKNQDLAIVHLYLHAPRAKPYTPPKIEVVLEKSRRLLKKS